MISTPFKIYPWPDLEAFEQVLTIVNKIDLNRTEFVDQADLTELTWCRDQLIVWKSKFHQHHFHELHATCALLTAFTSEVRNHLVRNVQCDFEQLIESNTALLELSTLVSDSNQQELCSLYATSLLEFFKMLSYYEVQISLSLSLLFLSQF